MARKNNKLGTEIASATIGAVIGGVLGMLFSPKSGKQNRATLAKEGRKVAKAATKVVQNVEKQAPKALAAAKKKQVKKA